MRCCIAELFFNLIIVVGFFSNKFYMRLPDGTIYYVDFLRVRTSIKENGEWNPLHQMNAFSMRTK